MDFGHPKFQVLTRGGAFTYRLGSNLFFLIISQLDPLTPLYYSLLVEYLVVCTSSPQSTTVTNPPVGEQEGKNVHPIFPSPYLLFTLNMPPSAWQLPVKRMGNFCSRGESIRNIEIEIEELRNEIASLRLARGREVSGVLVQSGRTTASSSGGGGISDQTTVTTGRRAVGHRGGLGGHGESNAIEELVPLRWRQGRRRGTGGRGGRSRRRAA